MGYNVPKERGSLTDDQRRMGSLDGFLAGYGAFVCAVRGCYVCAGGEGRDGGRNVGAEGGGNVEE